MLGTPYCIQNRNDISFILWNICHHQHMLLMSSFLPPLKEVGVQYDIRNWDDCLIPSLGEGHKMDD